MKPLKPLLYIALAVLTLTSCHKKRELNDQGHTNACWIYAMCTCIEHEAANRGDDVRLSRQWLMAKELEEQTVTRYLEQGNKGLRGPVVSMRNVGPEVLYLIEHYGLIPHQNEKSEVNNSNVLERKLILLADGSTSMRDLQRGMKKLLPEFSLADFSSPGGGREETFYYLSMQYNPFQFAESVMYYQHWRFFAPSPYHPHGAMFALEVNDNRRSHEYMNLHMKEILPMVIHSLREGHYVYWELGKRTKQNIVNSGHAMAVIGIAKNGDFICQNSYGSKWGNRGRCLISQKDFMEHTCNVGIIR